MITALLEQAAQGGPSECPHVETTEFASHRQLTLDDFSGARPRAATRAHQRTPTAILITTAMAVDAIEMAVTPATGGHWSARPSALCVRAYLLKTESGRRRELRAVWALRHEQGHFDLTHAHALRLEARLMGLGGDATSPDAAKKALHEAVRVAYREATAALQAEQDRYDRETRHGNYRAAQGRWLTQIADRGARAIPPAQTPMAIAGAAAPFEPPP